MKKIFVFACVGLLASFGYAATQTASKTSKPAPKQTIELTVVEAEGYPSGMEDPQTSAGLASFLGGQPKVKKMSVEQAKQTPGLANVDYGFLPLYMAKKTSALRKKLEPQLAAGYVQETDKYLIFPRVTRTGVYTDKEAKPGVLEIFVMSQCPYGVMAEGMVIAAQKEGKLPADKTIKIRYIVNYNEQANQFQSLHGSGEWEENVRQLLIAKYYPSKLWKYLEVRNQDYRSSRWDKAMKQAGINVNKIMKKFDTEGLELLKAEAAYGNEYGISASPTFLWEGKEILDFGTVAQKPGFEFLNPARTKAGGQAAAPAGSC